MSTHYTDHYLKGYANGHLEGRLLFRSVAGNKQINGLQDLRKRMAG